MIEIHTDGAYNPALQQGGWVAVIVENGQKRVFSGMVENTTSNRMEITAALEGILQTPQGAEVTLYTDSQYLFGCMTKKWQRRKNIDLLGKLDEAVHQRKMQWQWIAGDSENTLHDEAHTLANSSAGLNVASYSSAEKRSVTTPMDVVPKELTHLDASGRPRMVDVTGKPDTQREAIAKCRVKMKASTLDLIKKGKMAKGDVLAVAQLAGIMAAKQTPSIIPLCHPILLGDVKVEFSLDDENSAIEIATTVKSTGKTGVEMEALTATAVAALTIYDMCKAVERSMTIESIRLIRKSGGKSGVIDLE